MKYFYLKVLWMDKSIAFSLNQRLKAGSIPLTEFYFWPQSDAWEQIKLYIESLNWIGQEDAIILLNLITEIIDFWQNHSDENTPSFNSVQFLFPNVCFVNLHN